MTSPHHPPERPESARPLTYHDAEAAYQGTHDAIERFNDLTTRDLLARSAAILRARGEYDPAKYGPGDERPLTAAEHLEVLATGEMLARYYRHSAHVHDAVNAGATWEQIGDARGTSADQARHDYREWAAGQRRLYTACDGKFGLSDADYAAAVQRTDLTDAARRERQAIVPARAERASHAEKVRQADAAGIPLSGNPAPSEATQREMEAGQ